VAAPLDAPEVRPGLGPGSGSVLLGGAGWLLSPLWAVAGILAGPVAAISVAIVILVLGKPDPVRLLSAGRPQEACRQLGHDLAFARMLAVRRPTFRDVLANKLDTMSRAQLALGNEPRALEAAAEAAAIWADLTARQPGPYAAALACALLRQADRVGSFEPVLVPCLCRSFAWTIGV
jgi:hypothetical protein